MCVCMYDNSRFVCCSVCLCVRGIVCVCENVGGVCECVSERNDNTMCTMDYLRACALMGDPFGFVCVCVH